MTNTIIELAQQVIKTEIAALVKMSSRLNISFEQGIKTLLNINGRVVVLGMGKSGIIGRKIAATMASTGTPAFFVHPGEAFHGDLGMIQPNDIALMISNSGETEELIRLLPFMQYQRNTVIAMTGNLKSTLAYHANVVLDISVPREACNNNLAPTSSTTAALVMGDALAVVLSTLRGFQSEDFARFHPGGSLGRRLLTRVTDVMHKTDLPFCTSSANFRVAVHIATKGRLGLVLVTNEDKLVGIITDGDIRRALDSYAEPLDLQAKDFMSKTPKVIAPDVLLSEAEERMRIAKINALVVVGNKGEVLGVLQIYDL